MILHAYIYLFNQMENQAYKYRMELILNYTLESRSLYSLFLELRWLALRVHSHRYTRTQYDEYVE